jgi:monoamine oxidase
MRFHAATVTVHSPQRVNALNISRDADTLIIGAGAAGLAAASELVANGRHVLLLEARERLGGRILTDRTTVAPVPIELGAEFIHGESAVLLRWLAAARDVAIDASRERWLVNGSGLRRADAPLVALKRVFGRLAPLRRDMSFAEYLERHRRSVSPAIRELARMMVEGFDAADASRISAREVLDEWSGPVGADAPTFRPARGYDALMEAIRNALPAERATLQFGTVVRAVTWSRGRVTVEAERHGEPVRLQAARVVSTLPLGVLQLPAASPHAVRFAPELPAKRRALAQLAGGPVVKVVMQFARPFWAELDGARYRNAAFFFAPTATFPTLWTSLPLRTAVLVAWCAGSRAQGLIGRSRDEILANVFASLRVVFGRRNFRSMLETVSWHDWQADPFACGAYSYVMTGGARARRALAAPVEGTLFFAGEACDVEAAATVGGALQSGLRAAQQVLDSATAG